MDVRTRLLLASIAISLIFIIDVGANGRRLMNNFVSAIVRVTPVDASGWQITDDAPFMRKEGTQTYGTEGLENLRVHGSGDVQIVQSSTDMIVLDYDIRTYGLSRRHVQDYHEQVDITSTRRGDTLNITLENPRPPQNVAGVRVGYRLQIPAGLNIDLENEFGDVDLFGISGDVNATVRMGSVRIGEHQGSIDLDVEKGSIWLSKIDGPVTIRHESGRVEAVGIGGALDFKGERSTLSVNQVTDYVRADMSQGRSEFYTIRGPLFIEADRTRVMVADARANTTIDGVLSPIEIVNSHDEISVTSDRAHVLLRLASQMSWSFDLDARNGNVHTSMDLVESRRESTPNVRETLPVTVKVVGGDIRVESY